MIERIVRAIRLDWTVFREIAQDPKALQEAAMIVAIVTFLSAIGTGIGASNFFVGFFVGWPVEIIVGWIGWAVITYLAGTIIFKGETNVPEMMRVLGYAKAPALLGIFSFIPCVGWLIALAGGILSLVAGILAIREAMDFDTGDAIITVVISWVIAQIINFAIILPLTGFAL